MISLEVTMSELFDWTHDALEGLYDLAFLEHHIHQACVQERFTTGRALQEAIQKIIEQLRPPLSVSEQSRAFRVYNILNLRYIQGLTQTEAAAEMNLSVRHFKREQEKAINAAVALLFEKRDAEPASIPVEPAATHPAMEYVRIDELLRLSLNVIEPLLQQQSLSIKVDQPSALPIVRASRIVARQLLISALSWLVNGKRDAQLEISATSAPSHVLLQFIKPASAGPHSTLPLEASEEFNTVKQLAADLGARVSLSDSAGAAPGQDDTTLALALPVCETRCVLMIEDNPDSIELVKRYLEQSGEYHLLAVTRADEALEQAALLQPIAILLDIMMPERDGWDVLSLLKADPLTASIPVIVSSVVKGLDLAYALGAVDILHKPFSAAQLITKLHSVEARGPQSQAKLPA
jgi:CheY-like chemotaxis protein